MSKNHPDAATLDIPIQRAIFGRKVRLGVFDVAGKLLGNQPVKPGDNVAVVAKCLLRERSGLSGFYGPLPYRTH
jgi:hypothetical protein